MLLSMMVSLGLTPLWSMITKAYAEKDYQWISRLYRIIKIAGVVLLIIQFALVPFLQMAMNLWLGKGVLIPAIYNNISLLKHRILINFSISISQ